MSALQLRLLTVAAVGPQGELPAHLAVRVRAAADDVEAHINVWVSREGADYAASCDRFELERYTDYGLFAELKALGPATPNFDVLVPNLLRDVRFLIAKGSERRGPCASSAADYLADAATERMHALVETLA